MQIKIVKQVLKISVAASLLLAQALHCTGLFAQSGSTYQNPLRLAFRDPYVLHANGIYFMYGTGGAKNGFAACSSSDPVNWEDRGHVYRASNRNGWSDSTDTVI